MAWLSYVSELLNAETQQLDEAIEEEQVRLKEADNLHDIHAGMLEKRNEVAGRIALRRKALELLTGAIAHLSNNFNRDIKDPVAQTFPEDAAVQFKANIQCERGQNVLRLG